MIGGKRRSSSHKKSSHHNHKTHKKTPKVGDSITFYDVGNRVNVKTKIKSFITKSNKKGRVIKLAVGKNKSGDKVYRIVQNKQK